MDILSRRISGLSQLAGRYDGVLCDVWGVLHNGVAAWPDAIEALASFRKKGGAVVMITNAPRPHGPVIEQLAGLGVPIEGPGATFDEVVTSGDVTRALISSMSPVVYHLGPERDMQIYKGLDVRLVDCADAETVVCTGLFDDTTETPEDYRDLLGQLKARNLPFICANPDIVVERGDQLVWCAGALAREYEELGGKTFIVGKPYRPIYERAIERLTGAAGREIDKKRILAIGDGIATDIAGAIDFGLDVLYVSAGIHAAEYGTSTNHDPESPDPLKLTEFLGAHGAEPVAWLPRLKW